MPLIVQNSVFEPAPWKPREAPCRDPHINPRRTDRLLGRRAFLTAIVIASLAILSPAFAAGSQGNSGSESAVEVERTAERTLGDPSAPVTIYEFSSFTCPHCAAFHSETLPQIKTEFIDTGKAKLVFRDFPLDRLALAASVVARCVKPSQYFGFVNLLFHDQKTWATAKDPLSELKTLARVAGVSDEQVDACLSDQHLIATLQERRDAASKEFGINSTPTFVIGSETISGAQPFETFKAAIEAALARSG